MNRVIKNALSFIVAMAIAMIFICYSPALTAQVSVYTDIGSVYETEFDLNTETSSYEATNYGAVGVNYQLALSENLHHFETNVAYRFDEYEGIYANTGWYINTIPVLRNPRRNFRALVGAGLTYDGYMKRTDYYADARVAWTYERMQASGGAKVNLLENFHYGPSPEVYLRMAFIIYETRKEQPKPILS